MLLVDPGGVMGVFIGGTPEVAAADGITDGATVDTGGGAAVLATRVGARLSWPAVDTGAAEGGPVAPGDVTALTRTAEIVDMGGKELPSVEATDAITVLPGGWGAVVDAGPVGTTGVVSGAAVLVAG